MWISGRRAFRPDSQYYRNARKLGLGRRRRASMMSIFVALLVVIGAIGAWFILGG